MFFQECDLLCEGSVFNKNAATSKKMDKQTTLLGRARTTFGGADTSGGSKMKSGFKGGSSATSEQ